MGGKLFVRQTLAGIVCVGMGVGTSLWITRGEGAEEATTAPTNDAARTPAAATRRATPYAGMTPAQRQAAMKARRDEMSRMQQESDDKIRAQILFKELPGHQDGILAVQFSPDGKLLASAGADKVVKLWDVASGKELKTLEGHRGMVWSLAFSPDGKFLLTGSRDLQIIAWNVETGEIENMWKQTDYVNHLAFLPHDNDFISTDHNELIEWQLGQDSLVKKIAADDNISCMDVTKDGHIVTGEWNGTIIVWDPATGQPVQQRKRPHADHASQNVIRCVRALGNGDVLVSDADGLWRWNLQSNDIAEVGVVTNGIMVTLDSDQVAVVAGGPSFLLSSLSKQSEPIEWSIRSRGQVHDLAASPSGDYLAVAGGGLLDNNQNWSSQGPQSIQIYRTDAMLKLAREQTAIHEKAATAATQAQARLIERAATQPGMRIPPIATPPHAAIPWE